MQLFNYTTTCQKLIQTDTVSKYRSKRSKYSFDNLVLHQYGHSWFEELEDVSPISPPDKKDKEKVKEGKGIKILLPNKLLINYLPVLLPQIKARNNSYKQKKKNQNMYLLCHHQIKKIKKIFYITIKSPKYFATIQSSYYNNGSNN